MVMKAGAAEAARFNYVRPIDPANCPHHLFDHVLYDLNHRGYRVLLRCRCGRKKLIGKKVFFSYETAELKAKELMLKALKR